MANVGGTSSRGQLMLVAALGMAVLFVTLALTLNTVIYTENLATRGNDLAGGQNALEYRNSAQEGVAGLIEHTNYEHNTTYSALESNLSQGVEDWNEQAGTHGAASGAVSNTSLKSSHRGTRIVQDVDRNFTDDDANSTWTLAEDVSGTREFKMNISKNNLVSTLLGNLFSADEFMVQFDDGDPSPWNVSVYEESSDIVVTVHHDGTDFGECRVGGNRAVIDISGETVGDTDCPELGYLDNVSTPYSIRYTKAVDGGGDDTINGRYELIVDKESVDPDPDPYFAEGSSNGPYLTEALYKAAIRFGYNSTRLEYVSETEIIPGETIHD